jgi:hypothetical protein
MSNLTWLDGQIIASDDHDAVDRPSVDGCKGCVFEDSPAFDAECGQHACIPPRFPDGHAMRGARNIVWVKRGEA